MKLSHILRQRRVVDADGQPQLVRLGAGRVRGDFYHWLVTTSGTRFGIALVLTYLGLNALFALAYLACGNAILNARPGSFQDAFFFSVQTMATIGYGQMSPVGVAANLLVTLEAGIGLFGIAVASGLMFARFTRPTAGVRFSGKMVVADFDGQPTLMFRLANRRSDRIHEARVHVTLLRDEVTAEGHELRRLHDLVLTRASTPIFGMTWTVMHRIDPTSPFYGQTPEDLAAADTQIIVLFAGHHAGFRQEVHARTAYDHTDIEWGARFVDLFRQLPDGRWAIDFDRFDQVTREAPAVTAS
jgi:inward rectifier potassium channel